MKSWIILSLLAAISSLCNAESWPGFRNNSQRQAVSSEQLHLPLHEQWVYKPYCEPMPAWPAPARENVGVNAAKRVKPGEGLLTPTLTYDRTFHTVSDGKIVYFGSSSSHSVIALDAHNGKHKWVFETEGPVRLAPALYDKKVYAASDDGSLYCLDSETGKLQWRYRVMGKDIRIPGNGQMIATVPIRCGICIDDNIVYFAAGLFPKEGTWLCAVNAQTGEHVWKEPMEHSPQGYMVSTATRLLVPTGRTPFLEYDKKTGKRIRLMGISTSWGLNLVGGSFAIASESEVFTGPSEDGHLHYFNTKNSKKDDFVNFHDGPPKAKRKESVIRKKGIQIVIKGSTLYSLGKRSLEALHRGKNGFNDSTQIWKTKVTDALTMIAVGNALIVGTETGIVAFNEKNGNELWRKQLNKRVEGLSFSNQRLFVSCDDGVIHCYGAVSSNNHVPERLIQKSVSKEARHIALGVKKELKSDKGLCLVVGLKMVGVAIELAKTTNLNIVCIESDPKNSEKLKKGLTKRGLYGHKITVHSYKDSFPYRDHTFNAIITASAAIPEMIRCLNPYYGYLFTLKRGSSKGLVWRNSKIVRSMKIGQHSTPKNKGSWSHAYADAGNTACSNDTTEYETTYVQWFGRPGPRNMIDRHQKSTPPLYDEGVMYVSGNNYLAAADAYNGTVYWEKNLEHSGRNGVNHNCGNMVAHDGKLFVAHADTCSVYDSYTGKELTQLTIPDGSGEWGYLANVKSTVIGSKGKKGSNFRPSQKLDDYKNRNYMHKVTFQGDSPYSCSDTLFAHDAKTGKLLWSSPREQGVICNPAIACSDNSVFFLESLNSTLKNEKSGRIYLKDFVKNGVQLVCLDIRTGKKRWTTKVDLTVLQWALYLSVADNQVVITGSRHLDEGKKRPTNMYNMWAFNAQNGRLNWSHSDKPSGQDPRSVHGELNQHPAIINGVIYGSGFARKLQTGELYEGWKWRQSSKCTTITSSANYAFTRYDNKAKLSYMFDLDSGDSNQLSTVSRPGCWVNILPAGGLVMVPEASSGCTCGYSLQTTIVYGGVRK